MTLLSLLCLLPTHQPVSSICINTTLLTLLYRFRL